MALVYISRGITGRLGLTRLTSSEIIEIITGSLRRLQVASTRTRESVRVQTNGWSVVRGHWERFGMNYNGEQREEGEENNTNTMKEMSCLSRWSRGMMCDVLLVLTTW